MFWTLLEKMPELAVPLINEVFGTSYPEDIEIIQKRNEHQTKQGEIITDSHLMILDKAYHIECQSTNDSSMVIRMIEYDFSISLGSMRLEDGKYRMYFPHSCILYLRGNQDRKLLSVEMIMPDGSVTEYKVPAIYVGHYTKDEILQKQLFFLLPFYIMRYEKGNLEAEYPELKAMLEEYREIEKCLEEEFLEEGKEKAYKDLIELILRIAEYILRNQEEARKGFGDVMGGKVLELESDKLIQEGVKRGLEQERAKSVRALLHKGKTVEEVADLLDLTVEYVKKIQKEMPKY
ncbi:MAG: hypothetical protein UGF43_03280 [Blautia sp.]|uniref:hypothetical protein n=1 Tax=Blautia sp. TaxID=1955243 RepID=UPI002E79D9C9|nr:hypothetical protein [Blautia sp.]MEE1442629.1 hypothetical protein [Blautia sp.]